MLYAQWPSLNHKDHCKKMLGNAGSINTSSVKCKSSWQNYIYQNKDWTSLWGYATINGWEHILAHGNCWWQYKFMSKRSIQKIGMPETKILHHAVVYKTQTKEINPCLERCIPQETSNDMFQFQLSSLQIEPALWQPQNQQPSQPVQKDLGF